MTAISIYRSPAGERAIMELYDRTLAHWPVPCETQSATTRYGATFVIIAGEYERPPLLLLHGAGTNSCIWAADFPTYTQTHRVFAVDLLGEPGKSAPSRPPWDSPAYAEWLEDVLDALGLETAAIVGLSQGGWTALKFTAYAPDRVTHLGLLTPGGIVPDKLSFALKALPLSMMGSWGAHRMVRVLFADQPIPDGVEEITVLLMRNFKARIGVLPLFSDAELQRLTMPVLLVVGAQDALRDGDAISTRLQRWVPNLRVRIVPGAGHALLNTASAVSSFLNDPATPNTEPPA